MVSSVISEKPEANVSEHDRLASGASSTAASAAADRHILTEEDAYEQLGFAFPEWKKWLILTSIFIVQITMNFNAAVFGNALPGMVDQFGISDYTAHLGQFVFLVAYAFGCELWAPWSEELGRKWVLNISLGLVNLWQIPCALAPNYWVVFGFRFLGGLSSAGGSVTLGMVADMWEPADQQYAVAYVVFSSVAGSVVAPIVGGWITQYASWQWVSPNIRTVVMFDLTNTSQVFWVSLIFGVVAQALHLFVPETRSSILLARHATKLRKRGENVWSAEQLQGSIWQRLNWRECCTLMWRPYKFLITEPIVCFLSLLSGFSDALIFTGLDSFGLVLAKWNFNHWQVGLAFIPLMIGYLIAYVMYLGDYKGQRARMWDPVNKKRDDRRMAPEQRLKLLLWLVPLEPIGLLGFAFASLGPPAVSSWIAPLIFTALIGIANFAIYMATIDYMVAAYGPYAASATGGNGFCRDFLAGIAALYARPMYTRIMSGTRWQLTIPSCILAGVAVLAVTPVYIFYVYGPQIRQKSPYASELAKERGEKKPERDAAVGRVSQPSSPVQSRANSRTSSPVRGAVHV